MTPFQFAVLRYVHDIGSEEFVNVGVALWTPESHELRFRVNDRYSRLSEFFVDFDGTTYRELVRHLGSQVTEMIDALRQSELFQERPANILDVLHRVLPADASCLQWSDVMSGVSEAPEQRINELFEELVIRHERTFQDQRRDEFAIWHDVEAALTRRRLWTKVRTGLQLATPNYEYEFHAGWRNGHVRVLEPISFDLRNPGNIIEKANQWAGRLYTLSTANTFSMDAVVSRPRTDLAIRAFDRAIGILGQARSIGRIFTDDRLDDALATIEAELS